MLTTATDHTLELDLDNLGSDPELPQGRTIRLRPLRLRDQLAAQRIARHLRTAIETSADDASADEIILAASAFLADRMIGWSGITDAKTGRPLPFDAHQIDEALTAGDAVAAFLVYTTLGTLEHEQKKTSDSPSLSDTGLAVRLAADKASPESPPPTPRSSSNAPNAAETDAPTATTPDTSPTTTALNQT